MPYFVQSAATDPAHSWLVGTKLSLTIVSTMLDGVTHTGVSSTDGTESLLVGSVVVPFSNELAQILR